MRRPLIIGNWKMNKTASEAAAFIQDLRERVPASPNADVVVAPPFTALESVRNALGPSSWISLGAQNVHWETWENRWRNVSQGERNRSSQLNSTAAWQG